jgi:hypothetical protein
MRTKNLAIVAILGVLTILALLWAGNVVAGPPMQEPEGGEEGEVTAEGGIEAQALMDDGFWYQGLLTDGAGNPMTSRPQGRPWIRSWSRSTQMAMAGSTRR